MTENLEQILREHAFLDGLDADACSLVGTCARHASFEAGTYLVREGQPANELYLIRHGHVALEVALPERGALKFQTLGKDEIVGVSWLVPPYRWTYDARALDLVRAVALDARCLREECEKDHDFGYKLMMRFVPILIARLQATRFQILDIYGSREG
jgi:CRP/FNR family transcriptional regulator, cyclic AMP receptor protein